MLRELFLSCLININPSPLIVRAFYLENNMFSYNRVCKDCKKRYLGCHDYCKDYQSERDAALKLKEEMSRNSINYVTRKTDQIHGNSINRYYFKSR